MTLLVLVQSTAMMLAAVALDPRGNDWRCAALFLLGASGMVVAVAR